MDRPSVTEIEIRGVYKWIDRISAKIEVPLKWIKGNNTF